MNTVSSLSDEVRLQVATKLQSILIDLIALSLVAQRAHWNTRGSDFLQTHQLFGELYGAANDQVDPLAEYISLLGVDVQGDHVEVVKSASIQRVQGGDGLALCAALFASAKAFVAKVDTVARELGDLDLGAQQLVIDVSLAVGKPAWKIGKTLDK